MSSYKFKKIAERVKLIRSHGRLDNSSYFDNPNQSSYQNYGYNWRMSSITAALGITQLAKLDKLIKMRQKNAEYIISRISKHPEITFQKIPDGYSHIYQMFSIRLPTKIIRDKLHQFLLKKQIFSKIYFEPIHLTDYYQNNFKNIGDLSTTILISDQILTLPMYPNMTSDEKQYLTESIDEFFEL